MSVILGISITLARHRQIARSLFSDGCFNLIKCDVLTLAKLMLIHIFDTGEMMAMRICHMLLKSHAEIISLFFAISSTNKTYKIYSAVQEYDTAISTAVGLISFKAEVKYRHILIKKKL